MNQKQTLHITCYVQIPRPPAACISTMNNVANRYSKTELAVPSYTNTRTEAALRNESSQNVDAALLSRRSRFLLSRGLTSRLN